MAKSRMKKLIEPYVVRNGRHFRLRDVDPGDTAGFKSDKSLADAILQDGVATLQGLQEKLYAQDRWGVLLVFQAIRKFFLHLSKREQAKRFEKRLDEPDKQWKFSLGDLHERERWKDYAAAYEDTIRHTATSHAPWVVVPANKKWFARWVVAATVIDALEELDLAYPKVTAAKRSELQKGRRILRTARRAR